jgi:hypothetical protein
MYAIVLSKPLDNKALFPSVVSGSALTTIHVEPELKTGIIFVMSSLSSHPTPVAPIDEGKKDIPTVVSNRSILVTTVRNPILDLDRR